MGGRKFIDLTGKKFGKWVVICRVTNDRFGQTRWLCKCDCGKEKEVARRSLLSGESKSCGCSFREFLLKTKELNTDKVYFIDLIGKKFGRWIVIKRVADSKSGLRRWLCKCDCGVEREVLEPSLMRGASTSCGCYQREASSNENKIEEGLATKKHIYSMYRRGALKRNLLFDLSFEQFLDLTQQNCHYCGSEPSNLKHSYFDNGDFKYNGIDRKDNTKGYTIENCVSCCKISNRSKGTMSYNGYITWILKSADHIRSNNLLGGKTK